MYDFNRLYEDCDFAPEDEVTIDNLKNLVSVLPETREKYLDAINHSYSIGDLADYDMDLGLCRYLVVRLSRRNSYEVIKALMSLAKIKNKYYDYYSKTPGDYYDRGEDIIPALQSRVELIDRLLLFLDEYKL